MNEAPSAATCLHWIRNTKRDIRVFGGTYSRAATLQRHERKFQEAKRREIKLVKS